MKIINLQGTGIHSLQPGQAGGVSPRPGQSAEFTSVNAGDQIDLSPQARLMHRAVQIIGQTPEVRLEKVSALQEAVAQGNYRPDSLKIANGLLAHLLLER